MCSKTAGGEKDAGRSRVLEVFEEMAWTTAPVSCRALQNNERRMIKRPGQVDGIGLGIREYVARTFVRS